MFNVYIIAILEDDLSLSISFCWTQNKFEIYKVIMKVTIQLVIILITKKCKLNYTKLNYSYRWNKRN